ncbi:MULTISPECIES: phage tail tube protein [Brevibacillus]|uniref:Phage tail protein n=2 Tax=Brevibacillus TaxID=55080 RepID=C0ZFE9_BREBN|nr:MULTISPECIES: phage tail tube protein [Brevibacillus]MED1800300.1 phage tail tube protein [Brevibacillus porteri]MED2130808.1 phage tail tube protein [Brevibacillus porteri]MED2744932.1 phage tail tube protein [Brevibacillus porteri]MED2813382.1 phage tail tube protein [Brevibacillus porteri]MED2894978.1 phage tail tube protein [Brevibacillus porteri]
MKETYSGTHGHFYDQNGRELPECIGFELSEEFEKGESKRAGQLRKRHRVLASSVSMTATFERTSDIQQLIMEIAANPEKKVNFIGELDDKVAGKYRVAVTGFCPDSLSLAKWSHGELDEDTSLEGTVDDYEFI